MPSNEVLMVYPAALWPVAGGGARRALDLMAHVRRSGFRVTLATIDHGEHRHLLASFCDELVTTPPPSPAAKAKRSLKSLSGAALARTLVRTVSGPSSGGLQKLRNPALEELAVATAKRLNPVAVLVHFAPNAYCLAEMPASALKIVDTHDVQHLRPIAARAAGGRLDRPECTREEEIDALRHADILLAITPGDAATLHSMCPNARILMVSHAVAAEPYTPSPDDSRELLLVANLYDPNVRGLQRFLEESWPAVRASCPGAILTVCGRIGEAFSRAPDGVHFEGVVQDVRDYYLRAALVINPVLYGTGQAIKTLEALARGRALVCTPDGLRGLEHFTAVPCRVANHGREMAAAILDLFADLPKRHSLEARATEFARAKYSPVTAYSPLITALRARIPSQ